MKIVLIVAVFLFGLAEIDAEKDKYFNHIEPKSADIQRQAALAVIRRTIPLYYTTFDVTIDFDLAIDGKAFFHLEKISGKVHVTASSGVAAVWGFHYYLKEYCKKHVGWQVRQLSLTPRSFPFVNESVVANDQFRYYENVCTVSYSFIWWGESEWRDHIDWMALNGINMALAPHGQEMIWYRVYRKLGLSDHEIRSHFTGPAFLAWQRMGNIRGWGGPLSYAWMAHSLNLQHFIVNAMLSLGITPVLPSFSGYVPRAFKRHFLNATMTLAPTWNSFNTTYCCPYFLSPTDDLFSTVGVMFLTDMVHEFGKSHVYNADPFNEMLPTSVSLNYISSAAESIYAVMKQVDPQAIWLLQNWFFVSENVFWTRPKAKAFLTAVPKGKILVLDLQAEQWPQYGKLDNYFGQPYIWCMLHNFGGTLGMFGNTHSISTEVYNARNSANSTMVGIGLTMEGINQNYVVYDLMLESAWRKEPVLDLQTWVANYAQRRYGTDNEDTKESWRLLFKSVYDFRGLNRVRGKYVITRRPSLNIRPWAWYNSIDLIKAWRSMLEANLNSTSYYHDLVDLSRQVLQYRGDQIYLEIIKQFTKRDSHGVRNLTEIFSDMMSDLELILASDIDFSAYNWVSMAADLGKMHNNEWKYIMNAKNQITLWGPNGEISDYANKQWAELVKEYYAPRWEGFFNCMIEAMAANKPFNESQAQNYIRTKYESPFSASHEVFPYPTDALGNVTSKAWLLYNKWSSIPMLEDLPIKIIALNNMGQEYELQKDFLEAK